MNYRHVFHAGNFADVMKHVLLMRILAHLARKPAPFRYIDTHAGIGLYDLAGDAAKRTREWTGGVGLMEAPFPTEIEALLAPWRTALAAVRERHGPLAYPGSPVLAHEVLREGDRAILVEKHPEDHVTLAQHFRRAANVKAVRLDGWLALGGFIPPKERRGLVLIDPPFEEPGEFARCGEELVRAVRRWPTGTFALWYPVKREEDTQSFARQLAAGLPAPTIQLELRLGPADGSRLAGSGLAVVNPPWTLAQEAGQLLPALGERFGASPSSICEELVAEHTQRHARPVFDRA